MIFASTLVEASSPALVIEQIMAESIMKNKNRPPGLERLNQEVTATVHAAAAEASMTRNGKTDCGAISINTILN